MPSVSLTGVIRHLAGAALALAIVHVAVGTRPSEVPAPRRPEPSGTASQPDSAPARVAVRVAPSRDAAANRRVLDTFERYFEPAIRTFESKQSLQHLSSAICGHVDTEWVRRVRERNKLPSDAVPPNTPVTLPPCPFFKLGGAVTVQEHETVSSALMRDVGHAGGQTIERVASMNDTTTQALDVVAPGRTLRVEYLTAPVSFVLKAGFSNDVASVLNALDAVPGAIGRARSDVELSFVNDNQPTCEFQPPAAGHPFDADAVAEVLEFNARVTTNPPRKATIGVLDTGVDQTEARLFFALGADGTVGVNIDTRQTGFPTTSREYGNRAHGTHVAGLTLGGLQSPRLTALVRDRIHLKIINIVSHDVLIDPTAGKRNVFSIPMTNLTEAVLHARRDPQIPILNLSVETTRRFETMRQTLESGGDYLVVVAAGNANRDIGIQPSYPAAFKGQLPQRILTVAASLPDETRAPFSNHGPESVDLAAPGCSIPSILPDNQTGVMTGTSQAAPLVAFTAGLLYSEGLTPQEIRNRIRYSVKLAGTPLRNRVSTKGILDIARAISVREDLVTLKTGAAPLRGRIDPGSCVHVAEECRPPSRIARIAIPDPSGSGSAALAWLHADDGEVVMRPTEAPVGTLRFRPHGATQDMEIPFADVADVLFASRRP